MPHGSANSAIYDPIVEATESRGQGPPVDYIYCVAHGYEHP
jgi:hypothetical protein